ncbi:hypothetical protein CRYUN_Cryun23aG0162900 [Craigia yunnanensis]
MCLGYVETFKESIDFYTKVLGFVLVERSPAIDFDGAWLFNYGLGIHLVQSKDEDRLPSDTDHLDPMHNHISFQCEDVEEMEQRLKEFNAKYIKRTKERMKVTLRSTSSFSTTQMDSCNDEFKGATDRFKLS